MLAIYFRAFHTRGVYANYRAFRRVVDQGVRNEVAPDLVTMFERTVSRWRVKPEFEVTQETTPQGITLNLHVTGSAADVWFWQNYGVEGRVIRPSRARRQMRIAARKKRLGSRYKRDTKKIGRLIRPMALKFKGPGGDVVYAKWAEWPGFEGKEWNYAIANQYRPTYHKKMENIVRRGVTAAQREGH